jgi:3-mercaptopyruvate sulfurtransferase SseA
VIVDLARSLNFRQDHIPGAVWAVRTRLNAIAAILGGADHVVLTSPDGATARLAAAEAAGLTKAPVRVLEGGTRAWHAFGRPLVKDPANPPDEACVDAYLRPYDRNSGVEEAMHAYLSWEIALVGEIAREGTVRFG